MSERTGITELQRAIGLVGSQAALAEACKVGQSAISECLRNGKRVPAEWCIPIEIATKGEVTRHQLRSDLYPADRESTGEAAA